VCSVPGNVCRLLIGKREGNRPLGRSRNWWNYNIKIDLKEVEYESVDWTHPVWDVVQLLALLDMVTKFHVS
jgi:hypothetical protein